MIIIILYDPETKEELEYWTNKMMPNARFEHYSSLLNRPVYLQGKLFFVHNVFQLHMGRYKIRRQACQ